MTKRPAPKNLLQLRIELRHTNPLVWRTVVVPDTITLVKLHAVIQAAMGWYGGHLHEFEIAGQRYGMIDPEWDTDPELIDESRKRLLKVLGAHRHFDYLYDFGDAWWHWVTLQARMPMTKPQHYAFCVAGENACPPEDVGGLPGYYEFIEAVTNRNHEEHEAMIEWCGGTFDLSRFDIDSTNTRLKQVKL